MDRQLTPEQLIELGRCDAFQEIARYISEKAALQFTLNAGVSVELLCALADELRSMGMERRAALDDKIRMTRF